MKSIRVIYNNLKTKRNEESVICRFKDDFDTTNNDVFINQILSKEQHYLSTIIKEDIEFVKRDWEMTYDFMYGSIELNNGKTIIIDEIKPLASTQIIWGLQNLYDLKNLEEKDIKYINLEISTNKILFLSETYAAKFLALTHEEFQIYQANNFETYDKYSDKFVAKATIKSLLENDINDIEKSLDFER